MTKRQNWANVRKHKEYVLEENIFFGGGKSKMDASLDWVGPQQYLGWS